MQSIDAKTYVVMFYLYVLPGGSTQGQSGLPCSTKKNAEKGYLFATGNAENAEKTRKMGAFWYPTRLTYSPSYGYQFDFHFRAWESTLSLSGHPGLTFRA